MEEVKNKRREKRLRYDWPVRFAKGFTETLFLGQMVDVSSWGGAFTCSTGNCCPGLGKEITTLFSVPRFGTSRTFDMANYTRVGRVRRVDNIDNELCRIAIQFNEPLFFKPGEQNISEAKIQEKLEVALV